MMSTRAVGLGTAFRRAAVTSKFSRAQAVRVLMAKRSFQIQSLPPPAEEKILNDQRLKRPSSPHFTIYQPQLTWLSSIANRVTGCGLSGLLYVFSLAYLVAPETFSSAHIIEIVAGLPEFIKYAGKTILAAPFAYHALNGLRHLAWDSGKFLTLKSSYAAGYTVLAGTAVSTVALILL